MATQRATMVSNVRLNIQDTDTSVSTAFTDAQITTFLNLGIRWLYENYERRTKYVTLVASFTGSLYEIDGDATCLYPELLTVSVTGASGEMPLRPMEWGELRFRQQLGTAEGAPRHYAALKYGGAAVSASAQNLWKFALYPVPSSTVVLKGVVRDYPVALSADADYVDLGDFEAQLAEIVASILAAPRAGRPELAEDLKGLLPEMLRDKLETHATRTEVKA